MAVALAIAAAPLQAQQPENYRIHHAFKRAGLQGTNPSGSLALGADGTIYGTAELGGSHNMGTAWMLPPAGRLAVLHNFGSNSRDGKTPSGLLLASDGLLYGEAQGGAHDTGVIYSVSTDKNFSLLHTFRNAPSEDGSIPSGGLTADAAGLYGTCQAGGVGNMDGGLAFQMPFSGFGYMVLHQFSAQAGELAGGFLPASGLSIGTTGNHYGTTFRGGTQNGVIFKIAGSTESVVHVFDVSGSEGSRPGPVIEDAAGNIYGNAQLKGPGNKGTTYKMTPDGTFTLLHAFGTGDSTADRPTYALTLMPNGDLYGVTQAGGKYGFGVAFKIAANGAYSEVHQFGFNAKDGHLPTSALVLGPDGRLYGTTRGGGADGKGTVYSILPR